MIERSVDMASYAVGKVAVNTGILPSNLVEISDKVYRTLQKGRIDPDEWVSILEFTGIGALVGILLAYPIPLRKRIGYGALIGAIGGLFDSSAS